MQVLDTHSKSSRIWIDGILYVKRNGNGEIIKAEFDIRTSKNFGVNGVDYKGTTNTDQV